VSLKAADLFSVAGKVALVTGGSSGIGRMIASVLAANGVRTYIAGRKAQALEEVAAALSADGGDCRPLVADLSHMAGVEQLAAELASREPRLDILVNNAGAAWGAPVADFPEAGWDKVMSLNVKAVFFLSQKLLDLLAAGARDDDWSRIINISSVGARMTGDDPSAVYGPSKAAVEQLTRVMARQFAARRIAANCISPGWFPSKMNAPIRDSEGPDWLARTPLGRFGTAGEIGGLALFLASRAGGYINGETIVIDGGRSV
jgi:NAD(P)-dependent dehydrogenase (short-subunit alcohol dehydrogenase family)